MSNFQRVLIIIVLCMAVIFISGILLPKYLSTQILELRKKLNSQSNNSKYNLEANLVPIAEKLVHNESANSISSKNTEPTKVLNALANNSIQSPQKIKRRKKRQTVSNDEHFIWKFIFNLTGKRNRASQNSSDNESNTSHEEPFNIAVYAGRESKRETAFAEIKHNLRAVEYYFKYLLKNSENFTNGEAKDELELSNRNFSQFPSLSKGREGKFFNLDPLYLFGFLNSPEKSVSPSTLTVPNTDSTSEKEELPKLTESVQTNATENFPETPNFQTHSLVSELNLEQNETSNLPGKTEDGECVECDTVVLESPVTSNPESLIKNLSETVTSSTEFTDEFLKMFCMNILKNEGISRLLPESDTSVKPKQITNERVPKFLENPNLDLPSPLTKELNTKINILTSSDSPESEDIRQRVFFNPNFGLGSGRAADEGANNLTSEEFANVVPTNLPTILDCKKFLKTESSESSFIDEATSVFDETSFETSGSILSDIPKEVLVHTEPNDLDKNINILVTRTDIELQPTTELQRDSRFFLGMFGSGNGESRSLGTEISDTNIKEVLGSGDNRSFMVEDFEIDKNELESGNLGSLGTVVSDVNKTVFRNGDLTSFGVTVSDTDKNEEIGSGDSRSLWSPLIDTNRSEFGSGDLRTLKPKTFDIDGDFGSGDARSFETTETGKIGSGDMRSLHVPAFGDEKNEFSSGDTFKETPVLYEDQNTLSPNDQRFLQFLGIAGSGDGRELPENKVSRIEKCKNNCSEAATKQLYDCDHGCDYENISNETLSECDGCFSIVSNPPDELKPIPTEDIVISNTKQEKIGENLKTISNLTSWNVNKNYTENLDFKSQNTSANPDEQITESTQRFLTGSGDGGLFGNSGGPINLVEDEIADTKDHIDKDVESKTQNETEKTNEQSTEISERFLRPIFLTGSGDGGLFEDGEGPIVLVEEESSTSKSRNSLRQARLNDIPLNTSEIINESSSIQSMKNLVDDNLAEKITSPVTPTRRRGRIDDDMNDYAEFIEKFKNTLNIKNNSDVEKRTETTPVKTAVTVPSNIIWNRVCTAARECNANLNERCITLNSSRICGCSKGYIRNKITNKCVVKKVVETSIKLPAENFHEDLKDPFSSTFQQKRKLAVEMMSSLLQKDPELLRILSEIDIVEFSAGSLVIKLNLVFAAENKSESQLVQNIEDDLQIALRDESIIRSLPLDASEASLISVNGEIDYCKSSELNYCSENAYCVSNAALPGSYTCHCKEHYHDASFDPSHIGETCLAKCPKEYCGLYGHCELLANDEKICLCSGLYFGRRCEVPGLYVLIVLGCVGFISLTMLLLVVFKRRCSRFSYRESQTRGSEENGVNSHMNGKVSDVIALEENIGTRFKNISTPVPHPAIKVIRPTVTESGSSYDLDSTFDSTPGGNKPEADSTV